MSTFLSPVVVTFFENPSTMKHIAASFWGSPEKIEQAIDALCVQGALFHRVHGSICCCEGLLRLPDSLAMHEGERAYAAYAKDAARVPFYADIPFSVKAQLWNMILEANGRETGEGIAWARFARSPRDPFWQKVVARYITPFIKLGALTSTGHALIDRTLSTICTFMGHIPAPKKKQLWEILSIPAWTAESLPPGWQQWEDALGSYVYVCKDEGGVSVDGCVKVPFKNKKTVFRAYCYPPNERNRIALVFLFDAFHTVKKTVAKEMEGGEEAAPLRKLREFQLTQRAWYNAGHPEILCQLACALCLRQTFEEAEKAEQDMRWGARG